jgi:hypothetical protein
MKKVIGTAMAVLFGAALSYGAGQTWTGTISDDMCGASHKSSIEHSGKKMTDAECTKACVKGGSKYVFVSNGKVYSIANQDYAGLDEHAGHSVNLTGEMKDDAITVSGIAMAGKSKTKS